MTDSFSVIVILNLLIKCLQMDKIAENKPTMEYIWFSKRQTHGGILHPDPILTSDCVSNQINIPGLSRVLVSDASLDSQHFFKRVLVSVGYFERLPQLQVLK